MTVSPRWRKVVRDLAETPLRTALAVIAMAAGVFGLGAILTSYAILSRELAATYSGTRPASVIVIADRADDADVALAQSVPGARDAEARPSIRGRIRVGRDEWRPLTLFIVRDFRDLRIDTFRRDAGAWPPADDEVLLERSCLSVARAGIGDRVTVRTEDGPEQTLGISGTVHAAGLAPGWMDHHVSGFVTWSSIARSDPKKESARLLILADGDRLEEANIRAVAARVRTSLEKQGRTVSRIAVPTPGRHPHADQMDTFLFLLGAFGALTLALSAVLVANMIHALTAEQVRQIGIMKTIGASTGQVVTLYLAQVSLLATASLCVGIPLGVRAGQAYARFSADILNATIRSGAVPAWVIAVQVVVGMFVPLAVAIGPVYQASRISIHEAFSNGASRRFFGTRRFDRWLARMPWLSRPMALSLRTTFIRRGRLALTVATLATGGAVFMSTLNVSAAWTRALDADSRARRYDIDVRLARAYPIATLAGALTTVPGLARAEYWPDAAALLVGAMPQGLPLHGGDDERVNLMAPEAGSTLLALPVVSGRWLNARDAGAVVVNQALVARQPSLAVGRSVVLRVNGRDVSWPIVGIVKEMAPMPSAYAPARSVMQAAQQPEGTSRSIRIVTRGRDAAAMQSASRDIERALRRAGVGVLNVQLLSDLRKAFADHLVIINSALMFAAALVVLVGALGLASTMTLNVVKRTRELGIMSAIGATPLTIAANVVSEALVIGALSWCLAVLTAIPITLALDRVAGQMFIRSSLDFVMSPGAVATWLAIVLVLASLSSLYPARRAARLTVREALAYE